MESDNLPPDWPGDRGSLPDGINRGDRGGPSIFKHCRKASRQRNATYTLLLETCSGAPPRF